MNYYLFSCIPAVHILYQAQGTVAEILKCCSSDIYSFYICFKVGSVASNRISRICTHILCLLFWFLNPTFIALPWRSIFITLMYKLIESVQSCFTLLNNFQILVAGFHWISNNSMLLISVFQNYRMALETRELCVSSAAFHVISVFLHWWRLKLFVL